MRHSLKGIFSVALFATLAAGCSTVQVSQQRPQAEAPQDTNARNAH